MQWCRVLGLQQTRTQERSSCPVFYVCDKHGSLLRPPPTKIPHCDGAVFICVIALSAAMYLPLPPLQPPCEHRLAC